MHLNHRKYALFRKYASKSESSSGMLTIADWGKLLGRPFSSLHNLIIYQKCSTLLPFVFLCLFPIFSVPTPTISKITLLSIPLPHLGEKSCRGSGHDGTCGEQHCGGSGIERVFVVICCRFVVLTRRRTHLALRPRWAIFT